MTTELFKTGPSINKGRSRQDYETPKSFIDALEKRFGKLQIDIAASAKNSKAPVFFTKEQDSLRAGWHATEPTNVPAPLMWLNPPYGVIGPWAKKCYEESLLGAHILMLVPASVGSTWFAEYVHEKAKTIFLRPRITFEGTDDPYPKDLILAEFPGLGYECWRWSA